MNRSVSVELPSVLPGKYVVFISVIGKRNNDFYPTEELIKEQCKGRTENEKLAQVGEAYDLAHSKAASHLKRLDEARKKAEGKKASDSRRKERRKNWERRHAGRDAQAKQTKKNEAKKARLKAEKKATTEAEKKTDEEKAKTEAAEKKTSVEKEAAEKAAKERLAEKAKLLHAESMETDNASVASSSSSYATAQYTPQDSPRIESAQPAPSGQDKVEGPAINTNVAPPTADTGKPGTAEGQPEAAAGIKPVELKIHCCSCSLEAKKTPEPAADSDGYSSDSPVEDYENLYDSDDTTSALFPAPPTTYPSAKTNDSKSDDEDADTPDPWNAIAVVGFRVYSKDKDLELGVIMEGGLLEQDGMGTLGEADLDNAVANASGQREKKEGEAGPKDQAKDHKATDGTLGGNATKSTVGDEGGGKKEANADKEGDDSAVDGDHVAHHRTILEKKASEYDRDMGEKGDSVSGSVEAFDKV